MNPYQRKGMTKSLPQKIKETLENFLKTQFLIIIVVTIISWSILTFLGVKHALLLAGLTGSLSIIPYIGMIVSAVLTGIVAVVDGVRFLPEVHPVYEGVMIIFIYIILNQLIDFFLAPYITGKYTNIKPLFIFLSVLAGTLLFGIVGAMLAVPTLLIIKTILNHDT